MHDTKERLSLFWIFALLNYLYADVIALWVIVDSPNLAATPHLPPWVLPASAVFMEIPIAMIVACRLLPFRANRLANIIAGSIVTVINAAVTFVPPLFGVLGTPGLPEYLFFATIETVCTSIIVWQAWTWSEVKLAVSSAQSAELGRVAHPEVVAGISTTEGAPTLGPLQGWAPRTRKSGVVCNRTRKLRDSRDVHQFPSSKHW